MDKKVSITTLPEEHSTGDGQQSRVVEAYRRYRLPVILALLILLALIIFLVVYGRKKPAAEEEEAVVVSVRVATVERESIAAEVTALGTIFARKEATVSSKIAGQIKTMALLKNKPVHEGDVIATLEARDVQAQRAEAASAVDEARTNLRNVTGGTIPQTAAQDEKALRDARANLANARAVYERRLKLYEQGGISKKDLDASELARTTAENDLRLAEATARLHAATMSPNDRRVAEAKLKQSEDRLAALDTQLSYATIRAPLTGVIAEQFQFQGEFAAAGAKLFAIDDVSEVIVKAPVADTVAAQLKTGDTARVYPQSLPGEELVGVISLISKASDPQNRTVEVWVNLKNEDGRLHADSAAKVVVATQAASNVIVVPVAAVTLDASTGNTGTVMVVDENSVAHETKVTVGIRAKDKMEITSGLKGGETVVVEGNYALPDETKVAIAADEKEGDQSEEDKGEPKKKD
ncbi:MAG TPA: efflux RND transporter periplasmic adaptor subunit [Blastocatellia bacterium]|nr:efflux RND transporter periplasmic adaptor subunit [Blastocatellia bacterium]